MTPYYQDDWLTVYHGDCKAVMAEMEPESVHCVVTSPPYWGLRDYGTATWVGGDETCVHEIGRVIGNRSVCTWCGATRQDSQLGLEPTPEEYVANLVAVFREVRRVLRADGTVWLNLGDSYASDTKGDNRTPEQLGKSDGLNRAKDPNKSHVFIPKAIGVRRIQHGLKPKDLVGIPWRVAFALQADGWYLRSDIIWAKPNPMPESVTDRPTKSHEYIFLLSKSPRYFFDADAVREPHVTAGDGRNRADFEPQRERNRGGRTDGYTAATGAFSWPEGGRNIRSVWTMATQPYPGAHFATFPETLPERCIKAGTSEKGVCPECGNPWQRVTTSVGVVAPRERNVGGRTDGFTRMPGGESEWSQRDEPMTIGWNSTCPPSCSLFFIRPDPIPATVLDPFAGSGTTGMVAQSLSRRAVLIDLSLDYLGQLMARNADIPLGLGA